MAGQGKSDDLDLIARLAANMKGATVCPLADADAAPMIAFVTKYRDEWEEWIRSGRRIDDPAAHVTAHGGSGNGDGRPAMAAAAATAAEAG
jgi:hypothetical protein